VGVHDGDLAPGGALLPGGAMSPSIEVRPYAVGDEKAIAHLFERSYGRSLGEAAWCWRFLDSPGGPGVVALGWDGPTLAGHHAVSRVRFSISGEELATGLSGTTMTDPAYRGLGLFSLLAQSVYRSMEDAGMAFVWGFPNTMSHRGFIRDLGWHDVYEIPTFRLDLSQEKALPVRDDRAVGLQAFDSRFDRLWERLRSENRIAARRDRDSLTWRYLLNPTERYEILGLIQLDELLGYAVLKEYLQELHVVDILAPRDQTEVGESLVVSAAQLAKERGLSAVSMWLSVVHPLHRALERLGFRNEGPVTYLGARLLRPLPPGSNLFDFRDWYFTMGDSDVY